MTADNPMKDIFDWIDANADEAVADLQEMVRQPSISAQKIGLEECADLVLRQMKQNESNSPIFTSWMAGRPSSSAT